MDWFAVGIDAMEVEADKSCNDAKDKLIKDAPYSCNCHESQRRRKVCQ